MMSNILKAPLFICLGILLFSCEENAEEQNDRRATAMAVDYIVAEPRLVENKIELTGTLMAGESAMLSAETSGQVTDILFDEGQIVNKGKLLLKLDDRAWLAQKSRLESELETARSQLKRQKSLFDIKGISQAEYDQAQLKVTSLESTIREIDVQIDNSTIQAPFDGKIGLRNVSVGSFLETGAPVSRLVQYNPLKLEFHVPEKYAYQLKPGQQLSFTVAGHDSTFRAKVYAAEPAIREASRSLTVRAKTPNPDRHLLPGSFANISLSLDSIPDAIMIPTDAIVPRLNSKLVYRVNNGKAEEVEVQTGIRTPKFIQIVSGLLPGDTIMLSGLLQVREGMEINPDNALSIEKVAE